MARDQQHTIATYDLSVCQFDKARTPGTFLSAISHAQGGGEAASNFTLVLSEIRHMPARLRQFVGPSNSELSTLRDVVQVSRCCGSWLCTKTRKHHPSIK